MAILALASIGQHVIIQQRGFDLSVGGAISLAAVVVTVLPSPQASALQTTGCVLLALLIGMASGVVNGVIVALLRVPPLVATIGVNAVLIAFTLVISSGSPHTAPPLLSWLTQGRPLLIPNTALIVLIFAILVGLAMERTSIGRRFVALGVSPRAAAASGVPVNLYRIMTFAFAGFCFAASGVLDGGFPSGSERDVGRPLYAADGCRGRRRRQRGSRSTREHRGDRDRRGPSRPILASSWSRSASSSRCNMWCRR